MSDVLKLAAMAEGQHNAVLVAQDQARELRAENERLRETLGRALDAAEFFGATDKEANDSVIQILRDALPGQRNEETQ